MKTIEQRELRVNCEEILRRAEAGERFSVTVDGRPVAELGPFRRQQWVARAEVLKLLCSQTPDPTFLNELRSDSFLR